MPLPQGQVVSGPADILNLLTGSTTVPDGYLLVGDGDSTLDAVPPSVEKTTNFTAENHRSYIATATLTVTDPTPAAGTGFDVLVVNGACTIGGTAYTTGVHVWSTYHSGAWVRIVIPSLARANTWSAAQAISDTTASTSTTTGALTVVGGVGIGGKLYVGGTPLKLTATNAEISRDVSDNILAIYGGEDYNSGAGIILSGSTHPTTPGAMLFFGSGFLEVGNYNYAGLLTWKGATATTPSTGEVKIGGGEVRAVGDIHGYDDLVLPKTSGIGIKVDNTTPTFPWRDLEGILTFDPAGANSPNHTVYMTGVNQWSFAVNDQADCTFHIPHDWVPGTDIYIHVHWSHNGTNVSGNAAFTLSYTYAKGHNQANFPAVKSQTITYNTTDIATTPQYRTRVDELQLSDATGSGNYINRGDLEADGLILLNCQVTTLPTITGGNLFIHHIDIHYQSSNIGTKNKAPNFFS